MNTQPHIKQFFRFLEEKGEKQVPLKIKLLNPKDFKINPKDSYVEENLILPDSYVKYLPNNITVKYVLTLMDSQIEYLPNNLTVGDTLDIRYTQIDSIPNNLKIGGNSKEGGTLMIEGTPLSEKYTEEQIRSMIEEKGGYLKGKLENPK
jgi:hypothetical protein